MKMYRFDRQVGGLITAFGSSGVIFSPIVKQGEVVHIGGMNIAAGGVVGYHQATTRQLFVVVQGEGWVRGEEAAHTPIGVGRAAYWEAGEWHESGSEGGMVAIVIEGDTIEPEIFMAEEQ
jgi:quercetin dioxygenase-like cupin family protein